MGFTGVINLFQGGRNDSRVFRRRTMLNPKAVGAHVSCEQVPSLL